MKFISLPIALLLSLAAVVAASPAPKVCHKVTCPTEILKSCCSAQGGMGYCAGGICYCGDGCL
ncbi:hypothetical protein ASPZODRAFT_132592 [Penicilliopsis zonata CBS 506.65]|uniref:Invertebrate defensins family profile domain-containing protein n=1 Tax=Penicilliopsis zonata CBS 506.65 TaxID=1073090 RepID=A0A1L9SHE1_9EURO|nr:hypothetical protein ASPZODRAFT_132592 [Penicilliopsis zonata CBS 506.65]OJJ46523.1 hypothetical protein ASPZODRAFT_132592 [Penicilliopsis zonata CBS 506.65]